VSVELALLGSGMRRTDRHLIGWFGIWGPWLAVLPDVCSGARRAEADCLSCWGVDTDCGGLHSGARNLGYTSNDALSTSSRDSGRSVVAEECCDKPGAQHLARAIGPGFRS
jgi:hypothetical protein